LKSGSSTARRRNSAEDTKRRILDAALDTVIEIGYYKASSNEIARRAGVSWGTIQHLFGSRDQLMLDIVNYLADRMELLVGDAKIDGATLEERLACVLEVMAQSYDDDVYLVQMQILLELSANSRLSEVAGQGGQPAGGASDRLAQPLLAKALGDAAGISDLVFHVFLTFRGFLISRALARRIAKLPAGALHKPMGRGAGLPDDDVQRNLLINGVASTIRAEAKKHGIRVA